jgi:hypothetical protein
MSIRELGQPFAPALADWASHGIERGFYELKETTNDARQFVVFFYPA